MGNRVQIETPDGVFQIDRSEAEKYEKHYITLFSIIVNNLKNYKERINTILFDYDDNLRGYNVMAYTTRGTLFSGDMPFTEDHADDITVIHRFIKRWNDLPDTESTKEQYSGVFEGKNITFNREWGGYRFSDDECKELLEGKHIIISPTNANGETYEIVGKLGLGEYEGFKYWGFIKVPASMSPIKPFPSTWNNHKFTDIEKADLLAGKTIPIKYISKAGKWYTADTTFNRAQGINLELTNNVNAQF